ncbi:LLM class flavin-dependent oxidoreductase [Brevibacillus ginsengisoli]|uniref:LLM class flavin-dependent oxidoreductase n=1 Tax=Brevibacillus ginsengisoli TaxID=363854 RepID=UPI003CFAB2E8
MKVIWSVQSGDGSANKNSDNQLAQFAQSLEELGYYGVHLPAGLTEDETIAIASSIVAVTKKLRFLVDIDPAKISPKMAGRLIAAFDRMSVGRVLVNVVAGTNPVMIGEESFELDPDALEEYTREYLAVWQKMMNGEIVDYKGQYIQERGKLLYAATQEPYPPVVMNSSSSDAELKIAAEYADIYMIEQTTLALGEAKIQALQNLARANGKEAQIAICLDLSPDSQASEVRETIKEYVTNGIDLFVIAGESGLEDTARIAEGLF